MMDQPDRILETGTRVKIHDETDPDGPHCTEPAPEPDLKARLKDSIDAMLMHTRILDEVIQLSAMSCAGDITLAMVKARAILAEQLTAQADRLDTIIRLELAEAELDATKVKLAEAEAEILELDKKCAAEWGRSQRLAARNEEVERAFEALTKLSQTRDQNVRMGIAETIEELSRIGNVTLASGTYKMSIDSAIRRLKSI